MPHKQSKTQQTHRRSKQLPKEISPWEALDLDRENPNKAEAEKLRLEIKRHFRNCFSSIDGKWVLEYLNGKYFNQKVVDENAVNPLAYAGIREGEIRVLRYIHLLMSLEQ